MDQKTLPKRALQALTLLRLFIGWHFLYEGVLKLFNPQWSAKGYLVTAETFTWFYQWLGSDGLIGLVDGINIAILIFVGLGLVLGFFERPAALLGIVLLLMYYFAHPAFMGSAQLGTEGNYWIINKNLIEAAALFVLFQLPTGRYFGLEIFRKSTSQLKPTES